MVQCYVRKLVDILTYLYCGWLKSCSVTIQVKSIFASAIYQCYMFSFVVVLVLLRLCYFFFNLTKKKRTLEKAIYGSLRSLTLYVNSAYKQLYASFLAYRKVFLYTTFTAALWTVYWFKFTQLYTIV